MKQLALALMLAFAASACTLPRTHSTMYGSRSHPRPRDTPRANRVSAMAGAGILGAVAGGLLGRASCDDLHETDEECEDRVLEGALIGGGIGVLAGAVVSAGD
jgi:hypothetical protein